MSPLKLALPFALAVACALPATAQDTEGQAESKPMKATTRLEERKTVVLKPEKKETDGILPKAARSTNPLQLINPFAPEEAGDGADNLDRADKDKHVGRGHTRVFFRLKW